jgi:hypothetical protein
MTRGRRGTPWREARPFKRGNSGLSVSMGATPALVAMRLHRGWCPLHARLPRGEPRQVPSEVEACEVCEVGRARYYERRTANEMKRKAVL